MTDQTDRDPTDDNAEDRKAASGETPPEEELPAGDAPDELAEAAGGEAAEGAGGADGPEAEIAALKDKLMRTAAEMENLRRRTEREKADAQKYAVTKFARDLLSVGDNLSRALDAAPTEKRDELGETAKNLLVGVEITRKEFLSVCERHGIREIVPRAGEKFDPNVHQAMAEVPGTDQPNGTVVHVAQSAFMLEDRLLRPAMVTVAKGGPAPDEDGPGSQVDTSA